MMVSIASAKRASNSARGHVGNRIARESFPVALLRGVLGHERERGGTVEPERVHEIDPALGVRPLGVDEADVGVHEAPDDVTDGGWLGRTTERVERGPAAGGEVTGAPGDHRADQAVARTKVVVDRRAVLAGGLGDVADRHPEAVRKEELLGDVEQLRLRARRRGPIGLQARHHPAPCGLAAGPLGPRSLLAGIPGSRRSLTLAPYRWRVREFKHCLNLGGAAAMAELRFDGKAAIVTGGGRGLGRAYARLLAARGCSVLVNDPGVATHGAPETEGAADEAAQEHS